MEKPTKERYGAIVKFEPLCPVVDGAALDNTLVFECPEPFGGYYRQHPEKNKPLYVYFILKDSISLERFIFIRQNIKKNFPNPFHASLARIRFYDEDFSAIRIRKVDDYADLIKLQQSFMTHGVRFHKKHRTFQKIDKAEIRVEKFFRLEVLEDGFYRDLSDEFHAYFKINYHLSPEKFYEIANQVKYNSDIIDFDCALAFFYDDYKIVDIVRIYTEKINLDVLKDMEKLCTTGIERMMK